MRTPTEILAVVDEAQGRLGDDFDLRGLIWEVIADLMDSMRLALNAAADLGSLDRPLVERLVAVVDDYTVNAWGDD